ncbi:hypothetical protein [Oceanirhabdus sp. W0125-5]|uniref:hypothetical protein n=1 Tax=Oceanirhabdus sp. W0125-5 TaxID=2999116 RepID=UPI0022F344E9|nr:hypothetical protein [Oceanirhabdus sp. W0125-5]WBW94889.1 hypothetical protein OW730_14415 [Oceanirhabdus sp. W0125-5]
MSKDDSKEEIIFQNIVKAYHGVRILLNKKFKEDYVLTKGFKKYNDLEEALMDFMNFENSINNIKDCNSFIKSKVVATQYYLNTLLGKEIKYEEYVKKTIGVSVEYNDDRYILELKRTIGQKLNDIGMKYTKEDISKYFYNIKISENEFKNFIKKEMKRLINKAENYLGIKFNESIDIQFIDKDIPYSYYLSIAESGFTLMVNRNISNSKFNIASLKYAIMHEICGHAFQLSSWKNEIHKKKINQICGCEEDYGPEIFQLEGVGESIVYFIFDDEIDEYMEIELLLDELHHLVQNNSYIMYNMGESMDKCVNYYSSNYILADKSKVEQRLKQVKEDAFYRANLFVYGSCLSLFKRIAISLNYDKKKEFFRTMYLNPMTYDQIINYYEELKG